MVLVWAFSVKTAPRLDGRLDREAKTAAGHIHPPVTAVGWSVGGRAEEGGARIYRYFFTYEVENRQFKGVCYSTGSTHRPGDTQVEYLPDRPEVARVKGTRIGQMDRQALWLVLVPLLALSWLAARLYTGWRTIRMLGKGEVAEGRIVDAQVARATSSEHANRWRIRFEFSPSEGVTRQGTSTTDLLPEPKPGDAVDVIYLAGRPRRCGLLGTLVRRLEFNEAGNYKTRVSFPAVARFTLFLVSLAGNLGYGLWFLLN
jgi:hypothetical protein